MRRLLAAVIFLALMGTPSLAAVISTDLSANSVAYNDDFQTNQEVWILYNGGLYCDDGSRPTGGGPAADVDVYIVNDKNWWAHGDSLSPYVYKKTIKLDANAKIPLTKVWTAPLQIGKYDMVVDVDRDGKLTNNDPFCNEPVDKNVETGFWVRGTGNTGAAGGTVAVSDHGYWIDPAGEPYNEMLHLLVNATGENVNLNQIYLTAGGTGNDATDIARVDIINDKNGNGAYDPATDKIVGYGTYGLNNGGADIPICPPDLPNYAEKCPFTVTNGVIGHLLIAYEMSRTPADKTYYFTVNFFKGTGQASGATIDMLSAEISSATKSTFNVSCTGAFSLQFSQNPAQTGSAVSTAVSGTLDPSCDDKDVVVKQGGCGTGAQAAVCILANGGCTAQLTAPGSAGNYSYWACLEKNGDGTYSNDTEARGPFPLNVIPASGGPTNNTTTTIPDCRANNLGGCTNRTDCEGSGGKWCGGDSKCKAAASVLCQPPASSGTDKWCTPACAWAVCAGTETACFSSNGACQPCGAGQTCENFGCKVIQQVPACKGLIGLTAGFAEGKVGVIAETLSECNGKVIGFREQDCNGPVVGNCLITTTGCGASWNAPETGTYMYSACIDIDKNGNYTGIGESRLFTVTVPPAARDFTLWIISIIVAAAVGGLIYYFMFFRKTAGAAPPPPPYQKAQAILRSLIRHAWNANRPSKDRTFSLQNRTR